MPVFLAEGPPPWSDLASSNEKLAQCLDANMTKELKGLKSKILY